MQDSSIHSMVVPCWVQKKAFATDGCGHSIQETVVNGVSRDPPTGQHSNIHLGNPMPTMTGEGFDMFHPICLNIKHPINDPNYVEIPYKPWFRRGSSILGGRDYTIHVYWFWGWFTDVVTAGFAATAGSLFNILRPIREVEGGPGRNAHVWSLLGKSGGWALGFPLRFTIQKLQKLTFDQSKKNLILSDQLLP